MLYKLLLLTTLCCHIWAADVIICYYESWNSAFSPNDIDTNICTHINFAFLSINKDGTLGVGGNDNVIKQLTALKKKKTSLKLLFSIGGWNEGSQTFSAIAANPTARNKLVSSVNDYLKKYNFDGVDIDWEYPAQREGSKPADKTNFVELLKALNKKLKQDKKLLTIAVSSSPDSKSYDVKQIVKYVDYINVMTYDFHGFSEKKAGHNAPLLPRPDESDWEKKNLNVEAAIKNWKREGAPSKKLILGYAFYGHSYTLLNTKNHDVGAAVTKDNGQLPYSEICKLKSGWTEVWDNKQKVPYKYKDTTWISYDNPRSLKEKGQFAKKENLGGVMIWAVDQDDKNGSCGTKFPLLKEVKKNI